MKDVKTSSPIAPPIARDRWDMITGMCCATCMYCSPKVCNTGRCRRHSPSMQGYPVVYLDADWCGDHKVGTNPHKAALMSSPQVGRPPYDAKEGLQGEQARDKEA